MATKFGDTVQAIRRAAGKTLQDVAGELEVSSAFLSAIENGKKRIPDGFVDRLAGALPEIRESSLSLESLAVQARGEVVVELPHATEEDAALAVSIARKFGSLSENQKKSLRDILKDS